jgi:hypothetical protein
MAIARLNEIEEEMAPKNDVSAADREAIRQDTMMRANNVNTIAAA